MYFTQKSYKWDILDEKNSKSLLSSKLIIYKNVIFFCSHHFFVKFSILENIYISPATWVECDTRSIFKQFNRLEFSFPFPRLVAILRLMSQLFLLLTYSLRENWLQAFLNDIISMWNANSIWILVTVSFLQRSHRMSLSLSLVCVCVYIYIIYIYIYIYIYIHTHTHTHTSVDSL